MKYNKVNVSDVITVGVWIAVAVCAVIMTGDIVGGFLIYVLGNLASDLYNIRKLLEGKKK